MSQPIIVNNPGTSEGGNGIGFMVGAVVLVALIVGGFFYGLPYIRRSTPVVPEINQVNIPDQIDVNITQDAPEAPQQ